MGFWYLSHVRATKAQASLCNCTGSPEASCSQAQCMHKDEDSDQTIDPNRAGYVSIHVAVETR